MAGEMNSSRAASRNPFRFGGVDLPMPLILLPVLGSGFVPTDSMPDGLRWFAEYQPFTPIIETLRGLLMDKPIGNNAWIALAWCALIALGGYLWSKRLFNREYTR